jgi:hypothetical protein
VSEVLAQIKNDRFTAGIVLRDDRVIDAAPIVKYMKGWKRDSVRSYCKERRWQISVVMTDD